MLANLEQAKHFAHMLSGVSLITSGEVLFYPPPVTLHPAPSSISIGSLTQDELAVWRGHNMGIVYQSFELLPQIDLVNNIMLPQEFLGIIRQA